MTAERQLSLAATSERGMDRERGTDDLRTTMDATQFGNSAFADGIEG
jgi:hypothetical protein